MRAVVMIALAGCGSSAVDMTLLVPSDSSQPPFILTCVSAVDVLPLGTNDTMQFEFENRTDDFPCISIKTPVEKFTKLAAAMANQVDVPLPAGGLGAVALRGRRGTCNENPAKYEAVFYGGAAYKPGDTELKVPIARSLSCDATASFTVKPVEMIKLFTSAAPHTCTDYIDAGSQVFSADIRATLVPTHPVELERGASSAPMSAATATVDSFSAAYKGTCAAIGLENTDKTITGLSCINAGVPSACGAGALELALVPAAYAKAVADANMQYSGATIVGVWSNAGTVGPIADATVKVTEGDGKVVYGSLQSSGFIAGTGASTDATGGAVVYANGLVSITVTAGGVDRKLLVGGAPGATSAIIAAFN